MCCRTFRVGRTFISQLELATRESTLANMPARCDLGRDHAKKIGMRKRLCRAS